MGLEDLLDIQVNLAMETSYQKAYNIHIGVSSSPVTVAVLVHISNDAAENLQAATEWKSAILDQKDILDVPRQQVMRQLKKPLPVKGTNHIHAIEEKVIACMHGGQPSLASYMWSFELLHGAKEENRKQVQNSNLVWIKT